MTVLGEQFRREGRGGESDRLRQKQWFIKARQENARREDMADKLEQNVSAFASAAIVAAPPVQIEVFETKLDSYDIAIVAALMGNQEQMDVVTASIADILSRAYVMDDGRRVFKTEDGTQVFDEHGDEVTREELDPGVIGDHVPTWETFSKDRGEKAHLEAERAQIIEFQEQADTARERISQGGISEDELAELDAALSRAMPDAVRIHIPGMTPQGPVVSLKEKFSAPATMRAPVMQSSQNIDVSAPQPTGVQ